MIDLPHPPPEGSDLLAQVSIPTMGKIHTCRDT